MLLGKAGKRPGISEIKAHVALSEHQVVCLILHRVAAKAEPPARISKRNLYEIVLTKRQFIVERAEMYKASVGPQAEDLIIRSPLRGRKHTANPRRV